MHVHFVFVTKYCRDVLTKTMRKVFKRICLDIA